MTIRKTTKGPTEGDLEAEIHGALRLAFPWLPDGSILHQTTFSFSLGGKRIVLDGLKGGTAKARADILLQFNQQPLAILELKRGGSTLDLADETQGLSYARVLDPRPPLVVVTNGIEVRLLETHTGNEWVPEDRSQDAFANLIRSASLAASHDLKSAISTLMMSNPEVWAQAVRQASKQKIEDLCGEWGDSLRPFVQGFLIHRRATQTVMQKLQAGTRLVLVEGPPLIGKTNVLRELTEEALDGEEFAPLFIEADAGASIFQELAHTLSQELDWPVSADEVRRWLLRLSNESGPALLLVIDGVRADQGGLRRDIEVLTSKSFGPSVRIVLGVDDVVADRLVLSSSGRQSSAIGRLAARVSVGPLDDNEFAGLARVLEKRRVELMNGAKFSTEFRLPWVLRAVISDIVSRPQYEDEKLVASIPPLLGLDLIAHTRERFGGDHELRRLFQGVAKAVIAESQNRERPISLVLESFGVFVIVRESLSRFLSVSELQQLEGLGYLRPLLHDTGVPILVVRIPELLASEVALLLAKDVVQKAQIDGADAALWLSDIASLLPVGDIVAAQALLDAANQCDGLPANLIGALINSPPREEVIVPGTKAVMHIPEAGVLKMTFQDKGVIEVEAGGRRGLIEPEPGDEVPVTYANVHSWLILSHLASCRCELAEVEGTVVRAEPRILLTVASCPFMLRRPEPDSGKEEGIPMHRIEDHGSIVCHKAGIVEPITLSILRFLSLEGESAEGWVKEATERNSFPLLARVDIALSQLLSSADGKTARFANRMMHELIRPAVSKFPPLH